MLSQPPGTRSGVFDWGATPLRGHTLALMASKDLYDILAVARAASADEIKTAYRKLARTLHPDVNKAPDAAKKFAEVQEAYDVLSDPEKRKLYDQYGHAGVKAGAAGAGPGQPWSRSGPGGMNVDFDPEDLGSMFDAFFGGRGGQAPSGSRAGRARPRAAPRPQEHRHEIAVDFLTAALGGTESLRISVDGNSRTVEVRIPSGTADGGQLRVRNSGSSDRSEADLILTVRVRPHELFRRGEGVDAGRGLDVYLDVPLTIAEATLGGTISVPTLAGAVQLTIPPGTGSGKKLRLKGKGITEPGGRIGDLFVVVQIVCPPVDTLSPDERDTLVDVSGRGPSPRAGAVWPK